MATLYAVDKLTTVLSECISLTCKTHHIKKRRSAGCRKYTKFMRRTCQGKTHEQMIGVRIPNDHRIQSIQATLQAAQIDITQLLPIWKYLQAILCIRIFYGINSLRFLYIF